MGDRNFEIHGLSLEEVHRRLSRAWARVNSEANGMRLPTDGIEGAVRYGTRHPLKDKLRIEGMQEVIKSLQGHESGLDFWLNDESDGQTANQTAQTLERDNPERAIDPLGR